MAEFSIPLGPFELLDSIARGGMGQVYRGVHVRQGVPVAVKVLTTRKADDPLVRAAFRNEVRSVARLHHRNIIMLFDQGVVSESAAAHSGGRLEPGSPYLAMELVTGGTLDTLGGCADWTTLRTILLDILDALAHAHARGVIHRDLKPANVLLARPSDARHGLKLTDFGIAHALDSGLHAEQGHVISGTLRYMAPEQLSGHWRDEGPWTDLYALGVIAHQLATGSPPFAEVSGDQLVHCHLHAPPPRLVSCFGVPEGLADWVERLLAKRPANRFERAADAAWALRRLAAAVAAPGRAAPAAAALATDETSPNFAPFVDARDDTAATPAANTPTALSGEPSELTWELDDDLAAPAEVPPLPRTWRGPSPSSLSMRLVGAGLGLYGLRTIPMLAREVERDRLWDVLGQVAGERTTRVVAIHGGAGYGKSRLVEWTAQRADEVGAATVLRANHSPISGPAHGLGRMIAEFLRCVDLDHERVVRRCQRFVFEHPLPRDTDWEAEAIAELIRLPTAEPSASEPPDATEGGAERFRLATPEDRFAVARRLLRRLSQQRPVILWLEDVQWGSDAIAFVDFLLRCEADAALPALVLLTYRDEALADRPVERIQLELLRADPAAVDLEIGQLEPSPHRMLVHRLLGLSGELAAQVAERTNGNPLFAVQLVGDWVQRGVLEVGATGFVLAADERAEVPDDIHQVWRQRVDRVTAGCADPDSGHVALEIAAALGQDIAEREWQLACRYAGTEIPGDLVDRLLGDRLALVSHSGWAFAHGMLRESLERSARERGRWASHHHACAQMLAEAHRGDPLGVADRRGRHLAAAGDLAAAIDLLLHAAEQRRLTSDFRLAHALYHERDQALAALRIPEDDPRWARGWVREARAYATQGELDPAIALIDRAAAAAAVHDWPDVTAWVETVRGHLATAQGESERAFAAFRRGVEAFRRVDEADRRPPTAGGFDPRGLADCLTGLGAICMWRRDLAEATAHYREAYRLHESGGDPYELGVVLRGMANVRNCADDVDEAAALLERARACFEHNGNRSNLASCLNDLGEIARARGQFERAERLYRDACELFETLSCADVSTPRFNLGLVLLARGDYPGARILLEAELARVSRSKQTLDLLWLHAGLLPCTAAAGDFAAWDHHLERVEALLEGFVDKDIPWCARLGGELAVAAGDPVRGRRAYELARQQWRLIGRTDEIDRIDRALGALPGDPDHT